MFEWNAELSVGIGEVDIQHRKIIDKINDIMEVVESSGESEKIIEAIKFLGAYTENHFETEEKLMIASGFMGIKPHKIHHRKFVKKLDDIIDSINAGRLDASGVKASGQEIFSWFSQHITTADRNFGNFLKSKMK